MTYVLPRQPIIRFLNVSRDIDILSIGKLPVDDILEIRKFHNQAYNMFVYTSGYFKNSATYQTFVF